MSYLIPYLYKRQQNTVMLSDFNDGIVLCRKLGLNPIAIILGKLEKEDIRHFAASGTMLSGIRLVRNTFSGLGAKLVFSEAATELSFVCEKWDSEKDTLKWFKKAKII